MLRNLGRKKDGGLINISLIISPIKNAQNRLIGISTIAHDITEHKRDEETLRESEKRYRDLFENIQEGFAYCRMIYDNKKRPEDFIYLNVNPAFDGFSA